MGAPAEVLILGAGIAGCALAFHLSERNVGPVSVFDPRTPAAGATGRAAGIVTEQLWDRWDVEVTRESKQEYASLSSRWDPSAYTVNGFLRWAKGPEAAKALGGSAHRLRSWGVEVRTIDPEQLVRLAPWGRFDDVLCSVHSPSDAIVTPSAMTEIYAEGARRAGVEFAFGTSMTSLRRVGAVWELSAGPHLLRARRMVVAAGAWSKGIFATLGAPLPMAPYRTQAAVLRPNSTPPVFPSLHDVDTDVYARPEASGRVLAGDGTELVEVDPERYRTGGDRSFVTHLAETIEDRLPGWADADLVRSWAGVCTSTPDRRPLVGPVPSSEGLFAMAGFNGFGVMRAGGVAKRLADLLASGGEADRERSRLEPVLPGRFGGTCPPFVPRPGFTLEGGSDPRF